MQAWVWVTGAKQTYSCKSAGHCVYYLGQSLFGRVAIGLPREGLCDCLRRNYVAVCKKFLLVVTFEASLCRKLSKISDFRSMTRWFKHSRTLWSYRVTLAQKEYAVLPGNATDINCRLKRFRRARPVIKLNRFTLLFRTGIKICWWSSCAFVDGLELEIKCVNFQSICVCVYYILTG